MSALDLTQAEVVTETGVRFLAPVANLATTGLFLSTTEALRFGQRLSMRLYGVSVRGEVLFVSETPRGVVVGLRATPTALATLEAHRGRVETVGVDARGDDDPWADLTPEDVASAGQLATQEIAFDIERPEDGEATVDSALVLPAQLMAESNATPSDPPIDPALLAAAIIDDESSPAEPLASSGPQTESDVPALPTVAERRLKLVDELEGADPMEGETTVAVDDPRLPTLEPDGFTVAFASAGAYQHQFTTHIRHGGLVVLAAPLAIGTQRMLSLAVPTVGTYTVSARVIFHTAGKLGFMVDSFGLHRARLAAMAKAS